MAERCLEPGRGGGRRRSGCRCSRHRAAVRPRVTVVVSSGLVAAIFSPHRGANKGGGGLGERKRALHPAMAAAICTPSEKQRTKKNEAGDPGERIGTGMRPPAVTSGDPPTSATILADCCTRHIGDCTDGCNEWRGS
jgi:hypothetical protein